MKRYIGSKRSILEPLFKEIGENGKGSSFMDPFAGSCRGVEKANKLGYHTFSNDLNALSRELGTAYTQAASNLTFEKILKSPTKLTIENLASACELLNKTPNYGTEKVFYEYYCPGGKYSEYQTNRGRTFRRNYFTPKNAKRIDSALNRVRDWWLKEKLSRIEVSLLLSVILTNVEKVANIKGTYAMPSANWEENAKKAILFKPDARFAGTENLGGIVGDREDALTFAKKHKKPDILYLDPPYNFRIYLDYYHIPNFIAQYPFIDNIKEYAKEFCFARGQNMQDRPGGKNASRFNKADSFHSAIFELIEVCQPKKCLISYFDGKNHFNEFDEEDNGESWEKMVTGVKNLKSYDPNTLKITEISRTNMQSQKGRTGKLVNEYILQIQHNA